MWLNGQRRRQPGHDGHPPVNVVLGLAPLQEAQRLGQVVVEDHGLVPQLANQQVLLLDLLFKRQRPLQLLLGRLQLALPLACGGLQLAQLLGEALDLRLVALDELS